MDVRIIAATNSNLVELAAEGKFKQDLLDRLSFDVLFVPPLKERKEDILLLANHFAARMAFELGREEIPQFSEETIRALERYPWPGNVRELKNVVERAVYRSDSSLITDIIFDPFLSPHPDYQTPIRAPLPLKPDSLSLEELINKPINEAVRHVEIYLVKRAIRDARYNQRKAAQRLGLTYHQFRGLYRKYREEIT